MINSLKKFFGGKNTLSSSKFTAIRRLGRQRPVLKKIELSWRQAGSFSFETFFTIFRKRANLGRATIELKELCMPQLNFLRTGLKSESTCKATASSRDQKMLINGLWRSPRGSLNGHRMPGSYWSLLRVKLFSIEQLLWHCGWQVGVSKQIHGMVVCIELLVRDHSKFKIRFQLFTIRTLLRRRVKLQNL
jgi:hypothetical protein